MFIVWYPLEFSRLHNLHPWYWNSLLYSLISYGKNLAFFVHFAAAYNQSLQFSFLVPPSTNHCKVGRGSMLWEARPTLHMACTGHNSRTGHPGSALLNFSDLTGTGFHLAKCYQVCGCGCSGWNFTSEKAINPVLKKKSLEPIPV